MAHRRLRHLLETRLGTAGRALLAWRTRGQAEALLAARGLTGPAATLAAQLGGRVQRGPFAGLRYPRQRGDIVHAAKLIGAYEQELHPALERLLGRAPRRVVNIGSGDGYYVVGLARRLPGAEILAVDPDPLAQRACAATARLNGVGALMTHRPLMDVLTLDATLRAPRRAPDTSPSAAAPAPPHALCIVDCEGYEDALLDPASAAGLVNADILVETHEFACAGVTARLTARFAPTHDVERVEIASRDAGAYPELAALPRDTAAGLLDEFRHVPQAWLVLTARARPS